MPRSLLALAGVLAVAASLSACGSSEPYDLGEASNPDGCATGRFFLETGICDDGAPERFRQINADAPLLTPSCFWTGEQAMIDDKTALVFRLQDCSAEGWDGAVYGFKDGVVREQSAMSPEIVDEGGAILHVFKLGDGQEAHDLALSKLALAPEAEQSRCALRPLEDNVQVPGTTFELAPDDAFYAELQATNEPWSACGPFGVGDQSAFWEARGGYAFFHELGQDVGYWDPASFTIYTRGEDGVWMKSDD